MKINGKNIKVKLVPARDFYNLLIQFNYRLADLREMGEFTALHLLGAENFPLHCLQKRLDDSSPERKNKILVYGPSEVFGGQLENNLNSSVKSSFSALLDLDSVSEHLVSLVVLGDSFEHFLSLYPFVCFNGEEEIKYLHWCPPAHIVGEIFLGSQLMAENKEMLVAMGVKSIVNCASEEIHLDAGLFQILEVPVKDSTSENIAMHFDRVLGFLEETPGQKLVHCVQGVSRSVTFTCAFLIKYHSMTTQEAIAYVKRARPVAQPNTGFVVQLMQFEESLG